MITAGFVLVLGIIAFADLRRRTIPNAMIVAGATLAGLHADNPAIAFVWAALAFIVTIWLFRVAGGGLGAGDVKLVGIMALWFAGPVLLPITTIALAGAFATDRIAARVGRPIKLLPLGTFLAASSLLFIWGAAA